MHFYHGNFQHHKSRGPIMLRKWSVFLLILSLLPVATLAQTTGKVAGQIVDASTGETLPGATVVVVGTNFGAATDLDGNYFIIGIPAGTYTIQSQFVGYQTQTSLGVSINAGYTRELNFELESGVELEELVIEYERPLIQKDAIGVPKIIDAAALVSLPVRGAAEVAKLQSGVVSKEGSGRLNIRGGRGGEVDYYVDGIKNGYVVPQAAIQQQEMLIGSINARYGDVMSGVVNIITKTGLEKWFGSAEFQSSTQFDAFGRNLGAVTVGGPISGSKIGFFVAAQLDGSADANPRNISTIYLTDSQLQDLWGAPMGLVVTDPNGNESVVGLPIGLEDGARLNVDNDGNPDLSGGGLTFSDSTVIQVAEGSKVSLDPISRAEQLSDSDFGRSLKKSMRHQLAQRYYGNLTWNLLSNARLKVGFAYRNFSGDLSNTSREVFSPQSAEAYVNRQYSAFATWTQYLSNSTFYEAQVSWRGYSNENYDSRFPRPTSDDLSPLWSYADIDHPVHATIAGYRNVTYVEETRVDDHGTPNDLSDDTEVTVRVPTFTRRYEDGLRISTETTAGLVGVVGGGRNSYGKSDGSIYRIAASATTQIGLNQLEFGAEYETSVGRFWGFSAERAARVFADGNPENIDPNDTSVNSEGYTRFEDIPPHILVGIMGGTGYNFLGNEKHDSENFAGYQNNDKSKPESDYYQAPHRPVYYGAFVQNKIEFRDIIFNMGLRVDVWDNNLPVLKDKYARRPIERAGGLGISLPTGINNDYAVYFSGNDVVGYRDLSGSFYDADGNPANAGDILLNGLVRRTGAVVTEDMFEDYKPQVTVMPRVGVSFPITDRALFFAGFGIVSQRPPGGAALLGCLSASSCQSNNNLVPEEATKYEIGFRQRLGVRQALTITGFSLQVNNLIQLRDIRGASPASYSRFENVDFGSIKGVEFNYDLRRTRGVKMEANYTLSFAKGTGSGSRTTASIVWIDETPPNFISPLDFDQRHKINVNLDYSLGKGEGPTLVGTKLLQNFGFNLVFTTGSGFPYTGIQDPIPVNASRAPNPRGGINDDRLPWTNRLDVRVARGFNISQGKITAFLVMRNVLNTVNVQGVYRYSALPDDDGFLATSGGIQFVDSGTPASETLYRFRNRNLGNFGLPRLTRLGIRFDF